MKYYKNFMKREEYLANPCKASSLPFWKTNTVKVPENMKILREADLQGEDISEYSDVKFFKLMHHMQGIVQPVLENNFEIVCGTVSDYADHIAACYTDIGISAEELLEYQKHPVYDGNLWVAIKEQGKSEIAASGIAEIDTDIKEGILEWIQVSPEHRGKGLGKFVVNELLWRMKEQAAFVTVSGKVDNPTNPRGLYMACGFTGEEIWHVMTEMEK